MTSLEEGSVGCVRGPLVLVQCPYRASLVPSWPCLLARGSHAEINRSWPLRPGRALPCQDGHTLRAHRDTGSGLRGGCHGVMTDARGGRCVRCLSLPAPPADGRRRPPQESGFTPYRYPLSRSHRDTCGSNPPDTQTFALLQLA